MGLMHTERRAHQRYVIDGLLIDLGGDLHETLDVSVRAVAVLRKPKVDYANLKGKARFVSAGTPALNCAIARYRRLCERPAVVVIDYHVEHWDWEGVLAANDVRADAVKLESVFG
jgi:hypothetical protein